MGPPAPYAVDAVAPAPHAVDAVAPAPAPEHPQPPPHPASPSLAPSGSSKSRGMQMAVQLSFNILQGNCNIWQVLYAHSRNESVTQMLSNSRTRGRSITWKDLEGCRAGIMFYGECSMISFATLTHAGHGDEYCVVRIYSIVVVL